MEMFAKLIILHIIVLFLSTIIQSVHISGRQRRNVTSNESVYQYLQRFGYIDDSTANNLVTEQTLTEAIGSFQRFNGLDVTGVVNEETVAVMRTARCGNKDNARHRARVKRFELEGSKWTDITYQISEYPTGSGLTRDQIDSEIARAFKVWSDVTNLDFIRVYGDDHSKPHIDIRFAKRYHGHAQAFDGPGNVLGHAFPPQKGGDAHFDSDETWTISSYHGFNLFQAAAHEFGHSLGLEHSDNKEALMAPTYQGYKPDFRLHLDDRLGIEALYGVKKNAKYQDYDEESATEVTETDKPISTENPIVTEETDPEEADETIDICSDSSIDAITEGGPRNVYIFKGNMYWELDGLYQRPLAGYPRRISEDWRGLTGNLDAAFTHNGKIYFFKADKYWIFKENKTRIRNKSNKIKAKFPGIPNGIDAAFVHHDKIYFYKGHEYWRFNTRAGRATNYRGRIASHLGNLTRPIDAAIMMGDWLDVFIRDHYYTFRFSEDSEPKLTSLSTKENWFGCKR